MEERRKGFAFENKNWFDLKRFGEAVEILSNKGYAIEPHHLLCPLPRLEVEIIPILSRIPVIKINSFFYSPCCIMKKIQRKEFLKRAGLAISGSAMGGMAPSPTSSEYRSQLKSSYKQSEISYSDTENFSYWESVLFRCFHGIANRKSANIYLNRYKKQIFIRLV